ncbi:hypothetical protein LPB72_21235 [Hydrogenophaga crassostreae]|uniref:Uncharacterized protein n=1 Tax=Hydrogenophaga crassostreae TaxID=1763535 RepID=A0A163C5J5_9BURK|nr:hypothetical protein LPB072_21850 [Hydrogenophaga crassostreae]OAD39509.1 hypothetical protein LPB72_21235 [Hydrogenophaga crassostreae]
MGDRTCAFWCSGAHDCQGVTHQGGAGTQALARAEAVPLVVRGKADAGLPAGLTSLGAQLDLVERWPRSGARFKRPG